jgi:hypothetical protein
VAAIRTVADLMDEIRSQLDENNLEAIEDKDILDAANRGQDYATNVLARQYPEPILSYTELDLTSTAQEYDIPEDTFEDRIEKIEINQGGFYYDCQRISFRDITTYESQSRSNSPYYYCVIGRKLRFVPQPTGTYDARVWYLRQPDELVEPQGRIVTDPANDY